MKHGPATDGHLVGTPRSGAPDAGVFVIPCFCGEEIGGGSHFEALAAMDVHCGVSPTKPRKKKPESPPIEGVDWAEFETKKKRGRK